MSSEVTAYVLVRTNRPEPCCECGEIHPFVSRRLSEGGKCGHPVFWPVLNGFTAEQMYGGDYSTPVDPATATLERVPLYFDVDNDIFTPDIPAVQPLFEFSLTETDYRLNHEEIIEQYDRHVLEEAFRSISFLDEASASYR